MISKFVFFSLIVSAVSAGCTWDEALCDKLPADHDAINAQLKKYSDLLGREGEEASLLQDVLAIDLRCMRDACDGDNKKSDLEDCQKKARKLVENQMQFVPSDYEQQLDKMCECDYASVDKTEVEGASINDAHLKSLYNCNQQKNSDQFWCHNAPALAHTFGQCDVDGKMTMKDKTREAMEITRIRKFCGGEVKAFVEGDGIVIMDAPGGCQEEKALRKKLVTICTDRCYYQPQHLDFNDEGAFFPDEYTFNGYAEYNGCEGGSRSVRTVSGRSAANKMSEICWEYLENPDQVPLQLQYPLYPASLISDDEIKDALKEACDPDVEKYKVIDHFDMTLDVGNDELKKLVAKGLATEYGFTPGMRRSAVTKFTGNCFDKQAVEYSHCNSSNPSYDKPSFPDNCEDGMEKMDVCDGASVESFNWFLKYPVPNVTAAVEACEAGAKFGRHVLTLPGLSTAYEAVKVGATMPKNSKTVGFLAFQDCAVAASMKANNYFEPGVENCNKYAMKFTMDE